MTEVVELTEADKWWVERLWKPHAATFGAFYFVWGDFLTHKPAGVKFYGVREQGFMRVTARKGLTTIKEIATAEGSRGVGRALVSSLPLPVLLETGEGNVNAQGFYQHLGFRKVGSRLTRKGKRLFIYAKQ